MQGRFTHWWTRYTVKGIWRWLGNESGVTPGSGGIDGQSIEDFAAAAEEELERLHQELKAGKYEPRAVRQQLIPKAGQPGKMRPLGIPTIYDRVCQQAVLNRLEGIFEPVFDEANFGYRAGKSAQKGALSEDMGRE